RGVETQRAHVVDELAPRQLPRADHDRVHREHLRIVADLHVQAGVVDALVLDTAKHVHATLLQERAPDPAGGLGKTGTDLRFLALQEPHLAQRAAGMRLRDAAALPHVAIDAPLRAEGVDRALIECGDIALAPVREELRDIEADAPRADDRGAPSHRSAAFDDGGVARDLRVIDTGNVRYARHDPGGEDHLVESGE